MLRDRILLFDQEPDHAELLEYNLTRAGYDVRRAHSEGEVLSAASLFSPNLVMIGNCSSEDEKTSLIRGLSQDIPAVAPAILCLTTDPYYQSRYSLSAVCIVLPARPRDILTEVGRLLGSSAN